MITIAFFFASCALDIAVFIPSSHSLPLQDPKRCKSLERRKKNKQKKNVVGWRWKWLGIRCHYRWSDMLHNDSKCKLKESVACSNIYTCSNNCQSRQSSAKREPGAGQEGGNEFTSTERWYHNLHATTHTMSQVMLHSFSVYHFP